jgi:DNA-binding NtrC family response regulator
MQSILVVDDQELMREMLEETFKRAGYEVAAVSSGAAALDSLAAASHDVVVTDLKMPGMDGIELLKKIRAQFGDIPVILITAHASIPTAVAAMKEGAFDYIEKPFKHEEITVIVEKALKVRELVEENAQLKREFAGVGKADMVLGSSEAMRRLSEAVDRAKDSPATVLITGESGTGKEVVARTLHYRSGRKDKPLIAVNCAALSAGLLESELFGHEKGAFTGAHERRKGRFELADKGAILLDEVSEINPQLQAKLLRVLQEKSFERVGSSKTIVVDVRVIATTNRDLEEEIKAGRFREDLFWRLNVISINVPPLRERPEDIEPLVKAFVKKHAPKTRFKDWDIAPETLEAFKRYRWPGNVRELENMLERAMALASEPRLVVSELAGTGVGGPKFGLEGMSLEEIEKIAIQEALKRFAGRQDKTAAALGIAVRTLRMKVKKWNLKAH